MSYNEDCRAFSVFLRGREERRERESINSCCAGKSNVTVPYDASVPLDIEDLKAEFDNAPAPTLDEEYFRGN